MAPGPIFVIGSGPMIGSHIPRLFAINSFTTIALFSRNSANLARDATFITSSSAPASTKVHTYIADVTNDTTFPTTLNRAVSDLGTPQIVIYNVARIGFGSLGHYSPADVRKDFEIANIGLIHTAEILLPLQQRENKNKESKERYSKLAFYITSGALIHHPRMPVYSLSMAKTAQASLAKILADEYGRDVHVALVTISGNVSAEEPVNNPTNIAGKFWELWVQERKGEEEGEEGDWQFEIRCGW